MAEPDDLAQELAFLTEADEAVVRMTTQLRTLRAQLDALRSSAGRSDELLAGLSALLARAGRVRSLIRNPAFAPPQKRRARKPSAAAGGGAPSTTRVTRSMARRGK